MNVYAFPVPETPIPAAANTLSVSDIEDRTGWAEYSDDQYTIGSPFTPSADTDTILPNNAGTTRLTEKPTDIDAFYIGGTQLITGRFGDGLNLLVHALASVDAASGAYVDIWFEIQSDPAIQLYRRTVTFPKGNGVAVGLSISVAGFTYDSWRDYGAYVKIRTNSSSCDIYNIRYVFTRTHKARTT